MLLLIHMILMIMEIASEYQEAARGVTVKVLRVACVDLRAQEVGTMAEAVRVEAERLGCSQSTLWRAVREVAEMEAEYPTVQMLRESLSFE